LTEAGRTPPALPPHGRSDWDAVLDWRRPLDTALACSLFPSLSNRCKPGSPGDPRRRHAAASAALVARIRAARTTLHEMRDAGVILVPSGPTTLVGRCPSHDDHAPSLWLYPDSGLWGCNRPDCRAAALHDVITIALSSHAYPIVLPSGSWSMSSF